MKTPREILLRQHQSASPKLDAIRAGVVAALAHPPAISWREWGRSLRWHWAAMSAVWMIVFLLNTDHSRNALAKVPRAATPTARQVWASLRENRRLLLQYTEPPAAEPPAVQGRRSEMETEQVEV